jgi:hypothetical protein
MKPVWTVIVFSLIPAAIWAAEATKVEGVLLDKESSYIAETRVVGGGRLEGGMLQAYMHTKKELLSPEGQKSGYGVFSYDQKYLTFDKAGNAKALALIRASKKPDDYRVEVSGQVEGDTTKVTSIRLLP